MTGVKKDFVFPVRKDGVTQDRRFKAPLFMNSGQQRDRRYNACSWSASKRASLQNSN